MSIVKFNINTTDYIAEIKYFTWKDALWLNSWKRFANSTDGLTQQIINSIEFFTKDFLLPVRELLNVPFIVHSWYRPPIYSEIIGSTRTSTHTGTQIFSVDYCVIAIDFHPVFTGNIIEDCNKAKEILLPKLDDFNIRMENNGDKANWIHLDNKILVKGRNRYFLP